MSAERRPCPNCSAPTPAGFRFCQNCGKEIPETVPTEEPPVQDPVSGTIGGSSGNIPVPEAESFMPTIPGAAMPQSSPNVPIPGSSPGVPIPQSSPNMPIPQSSPNMPIPGSSPGVPNPAVPRPHSSPDTVPVPQSSPGVSAGWSSDAPSQPRLETPVAGGAGVVAQPATDREPQASAAWGALISVNRDGSDGESYPLSGEWIDVGHTAEVSFDDELMAARHVRLSIVDGVVTITPLEDLNGVFIRVTDPTPIEHGTRLLLGRELLEVGLLREPERNIEALWRHGVAMLGSPVREAWGRVSQMLPNGSVRDVRYLVSHEVVIGREEGEVVFRDDEFLSRRHCKLVWDGSVCVLEDTGSSNGTFVQLEGPRQLVTGDHLRVGDQMFRFEQASS